MSYEVDTRGVERMVRELAVFAGHGENTEAALRSVTGKILTSAIRYTPVSDAADLMERVEYGLTRKFNTYSGGEIGGTAAEMSPRISNCPGAGKTWWIEASTAKPGAKYHPRQVSGGTLHIMKGGSPRRWSNERWARYQAEEADRNADRVTEIAVQKRNVAASRGLTRRSWVDIADALNIDLPTTAAYIKRAVPSNGKTYLNGTGRVEKSADGIAFYIENFQPILIKQDGAGILQRAIDARFTAFEHELARGVFDDCRAFTARYKDLGIKFY